MLDLYKLFLELVLKFCMIARVRRLLHALLLCKFFSYISVAELKSISKSIKIVKILISFLALLDLFNFFNFFSVHAGR